jgi:hypothetical protein
LTREGSRSQYRTGYQEQRHHGNTKSPRNTHIHPHQIISVSGLVDCQLLLS